MSVFRKFKTSAKHETEGVWLDYGEAGRVRIARAGGANKAYLRAMERLQRKYRQQLAMGILGDEVSERVMREVMVDSLVTKWELVGDDGPIPGDRQSMLETLEKLPELFRDMLAQAQNVALFREHLDEEDAGN